MESLGRQAGEIVSFVRIPEFEPLKGLRNPEFDRVHLYLDRISMEGKVRNKQSPAKHGQHRLASSRNNQESPTVPKRISRGKQLQC